MLYIKNDFNRKDIFFISILYFFYWYTSYIETSTIIKFGIVLLSLIYQLLSFKRSIVILILALFIPFISGYIGTGILRLEKIFSIIFLYYYFNTSSYQKVNIYNGKVIFISVFLINLMQTAFLYVYPDSFPDGFSLKNIIATYYNLFIIIILLFAILKKIDQKFILPFMLQLFFLLSSYMAFSLLNIIIDNPNELFFETKTGLLWSNKYFLHKNTWGLYYALTAIMSLYFLNNPIESLKIKNQYLFFILTISLFILAFSLSRRATIVFIFGSFYIFKSRINMKSILIILSLTLILFSFNFEFLSDRYLSLFTSRTFADFQNASAGQLHDRAIDQMIERFSLIPRFYTEMFEYNWMEGFYGQLLFRSGIIGFFIILFININLLNKNVSSYYRLYKFFIWFFILAAVGYRHSYFCNIYGIFGYVNILCSFFIVYNLTSFYKLRSNVD
tara:strand:+ start:2902 stop:4236 length:1335 start_codon:yes stop_codon:yes gene_type:complete